jgi:predicted CoA-binding protein
MRNGFRMIPVNPRETEVHGQRAYTDLFEAQGDAVAAGHPIEVVDIFRNSAQAGIHVDEAIEIGARAVWMQLGVIDDEAAARAEEAGLWVVMDRCPAIELPKLSLGA